MLDSFVSHRLLTFIQVDEHHPPVVVLQLHFLLLKSILNELRDLDIGVSVSIRQDQRHRRVIEIFLVIVETSLVLIVCNRVC